MLQQQPPMLSVALNCSDGPGSRELQADSASTLEHPRSAGTSVREHSHLKPTLTVTLVPEYPDVPPVLGVSHIGAVLGVKDGGDAEKALAAKCVAHLLDTAADRCASVVQCALCSVLCALCFPSCVCVCVCVCVCACVCVCGCVLVVALIRNHTHPLTHSFAHSLTPSLTSDAFVQHRDVHGHDARGGGATVAVRDGGGDPKRSP